MIFETSQLYSTLQALHTDITSSIYILHIVPQTTYSRRGGDFGRFEKKNGYAIVDFGDAAIPRLVLPTTLSLHIES